MRRCVWFLGLICFLELCGCVVIRNYDNELSHVSQQTVNGAVDQALVTLESNNTKNKDLLYYLEKGELLRLKGDLQASQSAWFSANSKVTEWENKVSINPAYYVNTVLSYAVNDKVRRYDGYDYEKVMLTTQMALNFLALNDWQGARVAIKQTHEREAIIARVNDYLYLKREDEAREQGIKTDVKDLNGYPIATLNTPSVLNLKNSYQNAFSHYLAGYVYEALGERDLAAPGYRNAIELQPNTPILEQGLSNLTANASRPANQADVLFVMQSGLAPKRNTLNLSLPISTKDGIIQITISLPMIEDVGLTVKNNYIIVDGNRYPLVEVASVDNMARRALLDELPNIVIRTSVRAISRAVAQQQLNKEVSPWAGLAFGVIGMVIERADTRTWRMLPDSMQIARLVLPKGQHVIKLPSGEREKIEINNSYQVVQLAQVGSRVYFP